MTECIVRKVDPNVVYAISIAPIFQSETEIDAGLVTVTRGPAEGAEATDENSEQEISFELQTIGMRVIASYLEALIPAVQRYENTY